MTISNIKKQLEGVSQFPPVEKWNPDLCIGQKITINREGEWFYNNSIIKNKKLINLFSTVLRKDNDEYFLVTPFEKVEVQAEIAPYKIIDYKIENNLVTLFTNLNFNFVLNSKNTSRLIKIDKTSIPVVNVRNNIEGFFERNIYYKLIDIALADKSIENEYLYITSDNIKHVLGKIA
tara:strand:+ start:1114 stop:1644 length:531 start_codon:yes stop_codon:yes gene_type:complete